MKRFDDGQDIIFRLSWHGDQEGGSSVHPRMDEIEVAESIRRQPDGRHNHIALLVRGTYIIMRPKNVTEIRIMNHKQNN